MRVRAAVRRWIAIDVIDLQKQRASDPLRRLFIQRTRRQQHENRPKPGQSTYCDFKAGMPVDAVPRIILLDPAVDLSYGFPCESLFTANEKGFRKARQVLLPV